MGRPPVTRQRYFHWAYIMQEPCLKKSKYFLLCMVMDISNSSKPGLLQGFYDAYRRYKVSRREWTGSKKLSVLSKQRLHIPVNDAPVLVFLCPPSLASGQTSTRALG